MLYKNIHDNTSLLYFMLFTWLFAADFMKTALIPIIKNKTGDTGDKINYRPTAAKNIMKYYTEQGSPVFTCLLDASTAFF